MVPLEALPSLIGLKGQKHKDTERATDTKIAYNKHSEVLCEVSIRGTQEKCSLAKKLVCLAVNHHLASLKENPFQEEELGLPHAILDIRTILFEIYNNKC